MSDDQKNNGMNPDEPPPLPPRAARKPVPPVATTGARRPDDEPPPFPPGFSKKPSRSAVAPDSAPDEPDRFREVAGHQAPAQAIANHQSPPSKETGFQKEVFRSYIAGLMILLGLLGAGYFFLFFDTSVPVPTQELFGHTIGGGRVNNLGLMADRQNGIIFSFGVALIGAVIEFIARSKN